MAFLPSVRDQLLEQDYAVVDDALDASTADALLRSLRTLHSSGALRAHRFGFRRPDAPRPDIFCKPHIFEAELSDEPVRRGAPELCETLRSLRVARHAAAALPELRITHEADPLGLDGATVKLQANEGGGGCFPLHYDNAGSGNRRVLTVLLYLNPGWREGDGGEMELVPWLRPAVRVPPMHNRAVVFSSERVLHRVLPAVRQRYCLTFWLHSQHCEGDPPVRLPSAGGDAGVRRALFSLGKSAAQRVLSRAVYADAYAASLRECMADAPAGQLEAMLRAHDRHVRESRENAATAAAMHVAGQMRAEAEAGMGRDVEGRREAGGHERGEAESEERGEAEGKSRRQTQSERQAERDFVREIEAAQSETGGLAVAERRAGAGHPSQSLGGVTASCQGAARPTHNAWPAVATQKKSETVRVRVEAVGACAVQLRVTASGQPG
jgi:hypothetical protein